MKFFNYFEKFLRYKDIKLRLKLQSTLCYRLLLIDYIIFAIKLLFKYIVPIPIFILLKYFINYL